MLRSLRKILGYRVAARDDEFGEVIDLYFDDAAWTVRYLAVDTGQWLPGRRVLLSPAAIHEPDWDHARLPVSLSRQQIEHGPSIRDDAPVSRESEALLADYFGWARYWEGTSLPAHLSRSYVSEGKAERRRETGGVVDRHLRSVEEVKGYQVFAVDGDLGDVADFIADMDDWVIRYVVVATGRALAGSGKTVLVSPDWISEINWADRQVRTDLTRDQVKGSPAYDPSAPVNRRMETRLYDHHGRPKYWQQTLRSGPASP
jgi:hypothetical protein